MKLKKYIQQYGLYKAISKALYLFGYPLLPLSYLFKRDIQKWVIGNGVGIADNSKYLFLYILRKRKDVRAIWIANNRKEQACIQKWGGESYVRWSVQGIWHCLTAGVYAYSHSITDVNYWTSGRAKKVNLWHGVGIKKLGYKGTVSYSPDNWISRIMRPYSYARPTHFITTSTLMTDHFRECYRLREDQILEAGYPRCDYLQLSREEQTTYLTQYESPQLQQFVQLLAQYKHIFIYMPTFRESAEDIFDAAGLDMQAIEELMEKTNSVFILKCHPASVVKHDISQYKHILQMDKRLDMYPILPYTDVLITDYSSVYYDYILMPDKGVILYDYDYKDYIANSRDLAYDYHTYTPGEHAQDCAELLVRMQNAMDGKLQYIKRDWVVNQFWGKSEKNSCEKIINMELEGGTQY